MNEELNLEKLADLAVHYPEYLIDAAAEHFNGDECKLEAIAVVVSGLDALCMPSSALLFVQVLSRMLKMEVELPAALMDEPYLCAWFIREFSYWLLQYVDDYCKLSQDE
ncbi:hypothetical protein [uncultured Agathobaculum sp.]|uniref:hypothetical protein n=1 Tax=uncultured Agathobaculum sp. TaxID=2048140 RepID=UPI00296FBE78